MLEFAPLRPVGCMRASGDARAVHLLPDGWRHLRS
jgi:hypothetical protein